MKKLPFSKKDIENIVDWAISEQEENFVVNEYNGEKSEAQNNDMNIAFLNKIFHILPLFNDMAYLILNEDEYNKNNLAPEDTRWKFLIDEKNHIIKTLRNILAEE